MYSVVTFSRVRGLRGLVELAEELGINRLKIAALYDHSGKSKEYSREALYHPSNVELSEKLLGEAKDYAEEKGIVLFYPSLHPIEYQCRMPSQRPYITVEGYVTPCCLQGLDPRNYTFGNVLEEKFMKIWTNRRYREFRKALFSPNPPGICVACPRLKGMA